jgi:Ribbon-helix-helix protein, copG family
MRVLRPPQPRLAGGRRRSKAQDPRFFPGPRRRSRDALMRSRPKRPSWTCKPRAAAVGGQAGARLPPAYPGSRVCITSCDTNFSVGAVNVRVDPQTAAFLERVARQTGRTKSEVVRQALETFRRQGAGPSAAPPAETMSDLIGCWDSGGMRLSERTGERFTRLLREKKYDHRAGGRRPARRPN